VCSDLLAAFLARLFSVPVMSAGRNKKKRSSTGYWHA
jgi:hypothetical protein